MSTLSELPGSDEPGEAELVALGEFGVTPEDFVGAVPLDVRRPQLPRQRSALPLLLAADAVALLAASLVAETAVGLVRPNPVVANALAAAVYLPLTWLVLAGYGLYRRARRRLVASTFPDLGPLAHALVVSSILALLLTSPLHRLTGLQLVSRTHVLLAGPLALAAIPAVRLGARWVLRPRHRRSRVLVVGSGVVASHVLQRLATVDGREVVGYVDDPHAPTPGLPTMAVPRLGDLEDLHQIVAAEEIDQVIVAFTVATGARLAGVLRSLASDVQISVVPRLFDLLTVRSHVDDLHGLPVVDVAPAALGPADRFLKRLMDVAVASTALLALSPVVLLTAVAIKLTSSGPVLFRQERTGRGGRPFTIYKFRSMRAGAESERDDLLSANEVDGPLFKVRSDARVTPIGRIIRATSIDELPQLCNVLLGTMSLVGPRPFIITESAAIDGWATRRFDVRPGMTGLWQTCGRSDLPFDELCRLDYSYVASWSLWWDLRIIWHTPAAVLRRRGAY